MDSVAATYQGRAIALSPHILGTTQGQRRVIGYEFEPGDDDRSNTVGGWQCLPVEDLSDVRPILGTWRTPVGWVTNGPPIQLIDQVDVSARRTGDIDQCQLDEAA